MAFDFTGTKTYYGGGGGGGSMSGTNLGVAGVGGTGGGGHGGPINLLPSADQGMESGVGSWVAESGTSAISQSSTQAKNGTYSLRLTSSSTGNVYARQSGSSPNTAYMAPVRPSTSHTLLISVWDGETSNSQVYLEMNWYNSAGSYVSTSSKSWTAVSSQAWSEVVFTATSPATAAYAYVRVAFYGGTAGTYHYIDRVGIFEGTVASTGFMYSTAPASIHGTDGLGGGGGGAGGGSGTGGDGGDGIAIFRWEPEDFITIVNNGYYEWWPYPSDDVYATGYNHLDGWLRLCNTRPYTGANYTHYMVHSYLYYDGDWDYCYSDSASKFISLSDQEGYVVVGSNAGEITYALSGDLASTWTYTEPWPSSDPVNAITAGRVWGWPVWVAVGDNGAMSYSSPGPLDPPDTWTDVVYGENVLNEDTSSATSSLTWSNYSGGTLTRDTSVYYSSPASIKWTATSDNQGAQPAIPTLYAAEPGSIVYLSMMHRQDRATTASLSWRATWLRSDNSTIQTDYYLMSAPSSTYTWERLVKVSNAAPAETAKVRIHWWITGNNTGESLYFDDVIFITGAAGNLNAVKNAGAQDYWVAVGDSGQVWMALDPTGLWSLQTLSGAPDFVSLEYGNGYWVAGEYEAIWVATDPTGTWTQVSLPVTGNVTAISYHGDGYWLLGTDEGKLAATRGDPSGGWIEKWSTFADRPITGIANSYPDNAQDTGNEASFEINGMTGWSAHAFLGEYEERPAIGRAQDFMRHDTYSQYTFWNLTAVYPLSSGKVIVSCSANAAWEGVEVNQRFFVLNSDMTLDTTSTSYLGWFSYYRQFYDVVEQSDGKIVIAYDNGVARFNSNFTQDSTFNGNAGTVANSAVEGLALQSDGKIVAVGKFSSWDSQSNTNTVVRLNTDGTLDTTFATNISGGATGGFDKVRQVAIDSSGNIYLAGDFTAWNGTSAKGFLRLTSTGTLDTTYLTALGTSVSSGSAESVAIDNSNRALVGYYSGTTFNGATDTNGLVRLNTNGSVDTTFAGNFDGSTITAGSAFQTIVLDDDSLLVAGLERDGFHLQKYSSTGVKSSLFGKDCTSAYYGGSFGRPLGVASSDDLLFITGTHFTYQGATFPGRLIHMDSSGVPYQTHFNRQVQAGDRIAVSSSGTVFVSDTGAELRVDGEPRGALMALNRYSGESQWNKEYGGGPASGYIYCMYYMDPYLLVGGSITTWKDSTQSSAQACNKIEAVNPSTGAVEWTDLWHTDYGIPNANVTVLEGLPDSEEVIVYGSGMTYWGANLISCNMVKVDIWSGVHDPDFSTACGTGPVGGNSLKGIVRLPNNDLLMLGATKWNGNTRYGVVRTDQYGDESTGWASTYSQDDPDYDSVFDAAQDPDNGTIVMVGEIYSGASGYDPYGIIVVSNVGSLNTSFMAKMGDGFGYRGKDVHFYYDENGEGRFVITGELYGYNGLNVSNPDDYQGLVILTTSGDLDPRTPKTYDAILDSALTISGGRPYLYAVTDGPIWGPEGGYGVVKISL